MITEWKIRHQKETVVVMVDPFLGNVAEAITKSLSLYEHTQLGARNWRIELNFDESLSGINYLAISISVKKNDQRELVGHISQEKVFNRKYDFLYGVSIPGCADEEHKRFKKTIKKIIRAIRSKISVSGEK